MVYSDEDLFYWVLLISFVVVYLTVMIFFLISQQSILKVIKPQNRKMQPGEVWLQLIPIFSIVWKFIVVSRISDSIRNEIDDRNTNSFLGIVDPVFVNDRIRRPTYEIGLSYCVLGLLGFIPVLGGFAALAALVCWIVYWTQIVTYKNKFVNNPM